jgi:hypothetical protein
MIAKILAYSFITTIIIVPVALIAGFHGNLPWLWVYVLGPVAWICGLAKSDFRIYLCELGIGSFLMSLAYWRFLIARPGNFSDTQRQLVILILHLCFGLAFHLVMGLPP